MIFSIAVVLSSCDDSVKRQQSVLEQADFPAIVTKVEAHDTSANAGHSPAGCFRITVKRVNGMTWDFSSNESFAIGDTLTIGIDNSHAFERVMQMTEESIKAFETVSDSIKAAVETPKEETTDTVATTSPDSLSI